VTKLIIQTLIALAFYIIYRNNGGDSTLVVSSLHINLPMGWVFGLFILLVLVGTTNAVNLTDGLDGLAGGLSVMSFLAYGVIAWGCKYIAGYQELAIFSFVLVGALLGFLVFNTHPAKVFMGDTGSLALGGALGTIAILTRHEISLIVIGGVFVVETLSSLIQIIAIRKLS
jgi:phospho-N-acetylmuramoyl-pentapeptide-transferase